MLFAARTVEMSNYVIYVLSLPVNFAARKSSLKKSQRVTDNIMQWDTEGSQPLSETFCRE